MEEFSDPKGAPDPVTRKTIEDYLKVMGLIGQVAPETIDRFVAVAVRHQLNPFLRELHLILGPGQPVAYVGYEVYLRKADRTGKLDGWRTWTEGEGQTLKAVLEVYRHDWAHPFVHEVHFLEAAQRDEKGEPVGFWKRMPKFQLRKVAIAQGFRLAFPDELGGIPYEPAELGSEPQEAKVPDHPESRENRGAQEAPPPSPAPKAWFDELGAYLVANEQMFTAKHLKWIRDQIEKTPTEEKAKAMLGYARKVVSQGGDPPATNRAPRTWSGRSRRTDPVVEPTF